MVVFEIDQFVGVIIERDGVRGDSGATRASAQNQWRDALRRGKLLFEAIHHDHRVVSLEEAKDRGDGIPQVAARGEFFLYQVGDDVAVSLRFKSVPTLQQLRPKMRRGSR